MPTVSDRFIRNVIVYLTETRKELIDELDDTFNMDRVERLGRISLQIYSVIEALKKIPGYDR